MKSSWIIVRAARILPALAVLLAGLAPLHAQTNANRWINPSPGKWEVGTNWVLGTAPSTNDVYDNIFNGSTVTIDATTSGGFPNTMTVNYVALEELSVLELDNAGTNFPLHILQTLDIAIGNPEVIVTNSALQVDGAMLFGDVHGEIGRFELDSGWAQFGSIALGNSGNGDLFLNGGTLTVLGTMTVGMSPGSDGALSMYGGTLIHTNNPVVLGGQGIGAIGVYGGSVQALGFQIGNAVGSQGVLDILGGTVLVSSNILVGNNIVTNPCSVIILTNGTLTVTNATRTGYVDVGQNGSLTLNGGFFQVDKLILTNGGMFSYISGTFSNDTPYQVENGGSVVLDGSTIITTNNFTLGTFAGSTGTVLVAAGGLLNVSNSVLGVGNDGTLTNGSGSGNVTVSNATLAAATINLGSSAGGLGLLTLQSNATVTVSSNLNVVSGSLGSTSIVSVTGGSLLVTNGTVRIGSAGSGQMTLSGGSHTISQIKLGSTNGAGAGSLYLLGGHLKILSSISANFVIVDGIDIDGSGGTIIIGDSHDALWQMMSGTSTGWATMTVGYTPGYTGTYLQNNGTMTVSNSLIVGTDCADGAGGALGVVTLNGGTLYVTNATHTAVLDVRNGTFIVNPGATLVVDQLVVTNACGQFMNLGGPAALVQNHPPLLDPYMDTDGDGMLNWQETKAGTDPLNPASVFVVTGIVPTNQHDLRVDWTTVGGHSYVVQTNGSPGSGVFRDATAPILVGGSGEGTTNYVHVGGATNKTGYYRVRLGP